jgi:tetratricopeptide (TPR) repeat protein
MAKISAETIAQYEKLLAKDPGSRVFAALADALREIGQIQKAEILAREGLRRHPEYVGGYLCLSRVLLQTRRADAAEPLLSKAVQLAPENILAYQLLGQCFLELKKPEEALRAHKMVLFLNPMSEKSREAVLRLEPLTAGDFDDDLFQMAQLKTEPLKASVTQTRTETAASDSPPERQLSFIDALIIRNQLEDAKNLLQEMTQTWPEHSEIKKRWAYFPEGPSEQLLGETLRPILSRERSAWNRRKDLLEKILSRVQKHRDLNP